MCHYGEQAPCSGQALRNYVNTFEKSSAGAVIGGAAVASSLARPIGCRSMTTTMMSPSFIFVTGQSWGSRMLHSSLRHLHGTD